MDIIFIIMILIFVVIPWVSKSEKVNKSKKKKGKKNNWGQSHEQLKNKYGHSGASNSAHKRLHSSDKSSAFPKGHKEHVRARDLRDAIENRKMEQTIHSSKNVGIVRAKNKGRSDWGARGDKTSFTGLIVVTVLAVLIYILATTAF